MVTNCVVLEPIHPAGIDRLRQAEINVVFPSPDETEAAMMKAEAVITRARPISSALLDSASHLLVVAKHGAGLEAIDVAHATALGIPVISTPGANTTAVAEHTFALMLAVAKKLTSAGTAVRQGDFSWKNKNRALELFDARLGIIGFGAIGQRVAAIARAGFGMRVVAWSPSVPDEIFAAHGVERRYELAEVLEEADVISIHSSGRSVPLIGRDELARLPKSSIIINTGRGTVIDQQALAEALRSGHLAGAGLDVFAREPVPLSDPLLELDTAVLSPHSATATEGAMIRMASGVAEQIVDVLCGRRPSHLANPQVWEHRRRGKEDEK